MFPVQQDPTAASPVTTTAGFFFTLNDTELLAEVGHLVTRERHATGDLVAALIEVDRRRLYLGEGCSSLYTYCTQILHLSEHAAYGRIQAARATSRFPAILPLLIDGSITLTTIVLLAPHLTQENHQWLLAAVQHKSKRHIEQVIARLYPQPDIPSCIRPLGGATSCGARCLASQCVGQTYQENGGSVAPTSADIQDLAVRLASQTSRGALSPAAVVGPLSPERYRVQVTIGREALEQLRAVQDLLRHSIPNGDVAAIFERALALLHGELMRKKAAATERPRHPAPSGPPTNTDGPAAEVPSRADEPNPEQASTSPDTPDDGNVGGRSRHIPAAVRREVWARDEGQCAFVGNQGRCAETGFLEFHHLLPYAAGGDPTVDNIELRCRPHNVYEAERYFGQTQPPFLKESRSEYGHRASNSVWTELPSTCPSPVSVGDCSPSRQAPSWSGSGACRRWKGTRYRRTHTSLERRVPGRTS